MKTDKHNKEHKEKKHGSTGKDKAKKTIADLEAKCEEYLNGWRRAQADYHNLQQEIERRKAEWIKMANADLLMELLPIYDNLKLALKHVPEKEKKSEWVIGVEHIKNQLSKLLEEHGVEEIETVGKVFDPHLHEAVSVADEKETEKDKREDKEKKERLVIKDEVRAGYKLNGKLLYPAKVIVQKG